MHSVVTLTVTLALTSMQIHIWAHRYRDCITTHTELCLPAGFASLRRGNTSFNQTGQLRTNFSFVVTAWGPEGLQSLYWQSAAHWLLAETFNNLLWILMEQWLLYLKRSGDFHHCIQGTSVIYNISYIRNRNDPCKEWQFSKRLHGLLYRDFNHLDRQTHSQIHVNCKGQDSSHRLLFLFFSLFFVLFSFLRGLDYPRAALDTWLSTSFSETSLSLVLFTFQFFTHRKTSYTNYKTY